MILFCLLVIPAYSWAFYTLSFPIWSIILINLIFVFINYIFIESIDTYLLKKPLEALSSHGHPEPLYFITRELLPFKRSEAQRQILLINHCVAMRELGALAEVRDTLMATNIDKVAGTLPMTKVVYYNNLSDIFSLLGDNAQAEIWYSKMMQIFNDMPENKFKKSLEQTVAMATAGNHFIKGEYSEALNILNQTKPDSLYSKVNAALIYAQINLKLNNIEEAKDKLNYIVANGNKLYAVKLAKEMLEKL